MSDVDATFRVAVTAQIEQFDIDSMAVLLDELTDDDLPAFAGVGVAMTANLVGLLAQVWGVSPAQAWETICRHGRALDLPGLS